MVEIGKINTLKVTRKVDFGVYLDGGEMGDILLPKKYLPPDLTLDNLIEVFIYLDSQDRIIATTEKPIAQVGEFAFLKVSAVNRIGAFLDWGLSKDLLVPFREQKSRMKQGNSYVVRIYLDEKSGRIVASSRLDRFLSRTSGDLSEGQEVDLLIYEKTELGYKSIINNSFPGMVFKSEIFRQLKIGQRITGYIKKVRTDGKIDLSLNKLGYEKVDDLTDKILKILNANGGYIAVNDKTAPQIIYNIFGMSKRSFKMAIGTLFREKKIYIEEKGVRVVK